jgi:transcriptional regulator with XRE-family HTH domain
MLKYWGEVLHMMTSIEFGQYIRDLRLKKGFSIRQLEVYSGVSNSYISQLENGKKQSPSPDILKKLSVALKVPYEEFLKKAGYINTPQATFNELIKEGTFNYYVEEYFDSDKLDIVSLYSKLSEDLQKELLRYGKYLKVINDLNNYNNKKKDKTN